MRTVGFKVTGRSLIWDFLWYQTCSDHNEKLHWSGQEGLQEMLSETKIRLNTAPKGPDFYQGTHNAVCLKIPGNSLAVQLLGLCSHSLRAQVQFLIWDLRFHKLHAAGTHTYTHKSLSNEQWLHRCIMCSSPLDSGGIWFMPGRQEVQTRRQTCYNSEDSLEVVGMWLWTCAQLVYNIWSQYFMANRWGNNGNSVRLYFWGVQNHCRWRLQP